jgi:hypothetical protein
VREGRPSAGTRLGAIAVSYAHRRKAWSLARTAAFGVETSVATEVAAGTGCGLLAACAPGTRAVLE